MPAFLEKKNTDLFVYDFADFGFPAHFHGSMEVIFVERGEIALVSDGKKYIVGEGNIGVVFPGRIHFYERTQEAANKGFLLLLGQRLLGEYKNELNGFVPKEPVMALSSLDNDAARALTVLHKSMGAGLRLQRAYTQLFLCHFSAAAELVSAPKADENILYRLVNYMEEHFRESISLADAAEALYINKFRLSGIFSRSLGMSFNDYLNSLRVNLAMQLMEDTDSSMTAIAFDVGFLNVRTFNRAFKKSAGVTPSEYKNTHRRSMEKI